MKATPCDTGSIEWANMHVGKISAGEFDNLVTPLIKERTGKTPETFLYRKAAEVFRGMPMVSLSASSASSWQMDQGIILEEEVIPWYSLTHSQKVVTHLFCETDDGLSGCTPDGLIGEAGGLEIKCPEPHTHCKYLVEGGVPDDYLPQIMFCLYVTGRPWWKFISYRRKFPKLIVEVQRDEEIMEKIDSVVKSFHKKLTATVEKLRSLQK
jgi:hypothetical protein